MLFLAAAAGLYHIVAGEDTFSALFTVAEMLQCLAMLLLSAQVLSSGSAAGISARAVGLEALASCCRLSSTLWLNGYLPVDESGDYFYQCVDICTLAASLWLLHQVLIEKRSSYEAAADSFPLLPIVIGAFLLAALFHANMNSRPIFDTLWMAGLFIGSVSVMPQLWQIMHTGGRVGMLMSHNIAAMALGRLLSGVFMYLAREDVTCDQWVEGVEHAMIAVLGAHLLHLLLLADFAYLYIKAVATQGIQCEIELDCFATFV
jgi:hypothetical protein